MKGSAGFWDKVNSFNTIKKLVLCTVFCINTKFPIFFILY